MKMDSKPKAIIFGLGNTFKTHKDFIYCDFNVIGLMSNHVQTGGEIDGIPVYSVEMLSKLEYDVICVTANYTNCYMIRRQLTALGVSLSKIRFWGSNGTYPYRIPQDFFRTDLCEEDKKRLFSENVERIVLEISSYCNRRCWFCPNSLVDRHSKNIDMEDVLFNKIVSELASIQYCYEISLTYFSEPMCSPKIYERISRLREALPGSYIHFFTNGDLLSKDALARLADAGCNNLMVDIYTDDPPGVYTRSKAFAGADKMILRLDLETDYRITPSNDNGSNFIARGKVGNMDVQIISNDFSIIGCNRAESLPNSLPFPRIESRPRPCMKPFISYHIAYNGNVYPCPSMHTQVEKHQQYCVGNLITESIFDIFTGVPLNEFRKNCLFDRDAIPCRSCIANHDSFANNKYTKPFRDRPGAYI